jgi:hypothetical protein
VGSLKDSLNASNRQTVTLSRAEVQFLEDTAALFQHNLDRLQQEFAVNYLRMVAVDRFEYNLNDKLEFKLDLKQYANNLEIIKHED